MKKTFLALLVLSWSYPLFAPPTKSSHTKVRAVTSKQPAKSPRTASTPTTQTMTTPLSRPLPEISTKEKQLFDEVTIKLKTISKKIENDIKPRLQKIEEATQPAPPSAQK